MTRSKKRRLDHTGQSSAHRFVDIDTHDGNGSNEAIASNPYTRGLGGGDPAFDTGRPRNPFFNREILDSQSEGGTIDMDLSPGDIPGSQTFVNKGTSSAILDEEIRCVTQARDKHQKRVDSLNRRGAALTQIHHDRERLDTPM